MNAIYEFLFFLVKPSFWTMLNRFDAALDAQLNEDLEIGFKECDQYYAKIGRNVYWVANYPFGYINPSFTDRRPSRMTIYRTRKAQIEFLKKSTIKAKLELVREFDNVIKLKRNYD